jgi:putative IMPACT (imprinted ancient) family translation regulator
LTNILVIVVRYFGGILLGTGGLVVAYKEATTDALDQAEVIEKTVDETISIVFDYVLMNEVMRIIKDTNAQISSQNFEDQCAMQLSIRKQDAGLLSAKLAKIYGLQIKE